jgi:lysophospholipase L1-like esterase
MTRLYCRTDHLSTRIARPALFVAAFGAFGCGRPIAAPRPTFPTNVVVFYDEDGNGVDASTEVVRLPEVVVRGPASSATTGVNTGRAVLALPQGADTLVVDEGSLPPFFTARALPIGVPATGDVFFAATLPIGSNQPDTYMGVGDSITQNSGYLDELQVRLAVYFGAARTINEGRSGTHSGDGAYRIEEALATRRPAYTLILYGTNDWDESACRNRFECGTIENLRYMIHAAQAAHSLPFVATIMPVNVGYNSGAPPERNIWVAQQGVLIRALAAQEGAVLVDLEKAFLAEPSLPPLFEDHVHPSPEGRSLIARTFLAAITKRQ